MLNRSLSITVVAVLVGLAAWASSGGCGQSTAEDIVDFAEDEFGLEVDVDDESDEKLGATEWVSGDTYAYSNAIHVDIGAVGDSAEQIQQKGTKVVYVQRIQTVEAGGLQSITLTDVAAGSTRTIEYSPAMNSIAFVDGADRAVVVQNPDKSYTVDGAPVANAKAAVVALKTRPVYSGASPALTLAAFAIAQRAAPEYTRACVGPTSAPGAPPKASVPPICTTFKPLCDCVACDKSGKTSCPSCP